MCTVLILSRVHPEFPVVIAANRDELYAREARTAQVLRRDPTAIGGVDVLSGGTWMGVRADGVVVALTNQRPTISVDRGLRSRGEIVMSALAMESAAAIRDNVEQLDAAAYNSFNLVFGDATGLTVAYVRQDPASIEIVAVPDGIHVLPSDVLDCDKLPRVARAAALAAPHAHSPWPNLRDGLVAALSDHQAAQPWDSVCIHTESYGTRSAMIVALAPDGVAHCEFADGPLCRAQLRDVRPLLEP